MALRFDSQRVLVNIRGAATDDLLDRVAVYRAEMEPEALPLIEAELRDRGVTAAQIADYRAQMETQVVRRQDGSVVKCSLCRRPAVAQGWGWHKLWGKVPLFPRWLAYCAKHNKKPQE